MCNADALMLPMLSIANRSITVQTAILSSAFCVASKVIIPRYLLAPSDDTLVEGSMPSQYLGPLMSLNNSEYRRPIHPLTCPSGLPVGPLSISIFTNLAAALPCGIHHGLGGGHVYLICLSIHQPPSFLHLLPHLPWAHDAPLRSMTNPLSTPPTLF